MLCVALFVAITALAIMRLLDDGPVSPMRYAVGRAGIDVEEFFLANEDKFEYIVDRLRESSYVGGELWIGITKRTNEAVFSTDDYFFKTRTLPEDLGIILDDEFVECLRVILIEGKLGRVFVKRYPTWPEFKVVFGNRRLAEASINYYEPVEAFQVTEEKIKGNWFYQKE